MISKKDIDEIRNRETTLRSFWAETPEMFINRKSGKLIKSELTISSLKADSNYHGTTKKWKETLVEEIHFNFNEMRGYENFNKCSVFIGKDVRFLFERYISSYKAVNSSYISSSNIGTLMDVFDVYYSRNILENEVYIYTQNDKWSLISIV